MAGEDILVAETFGRGIEQDLLQRAAMDRELRPFITGVQSTRLAPDRLAVLGEIGELLGAHARCRELIEQPELDQFAHGMRQHVDADAECPQLRHALDHPGGHADLVQAERQRQPANSATCDQYRHDPPSLLVMVMTWERGRGQPRKPLKALPRDGRRRLLSLTSGHPWEDTKMYKLYYAPGTCALASHIALEEAGADYSAMRLDFKANQQQSPDYLKINAKGRVPALVTDKGVITETPAILAYIAQTFPKAKLAPIDDAFAFAQVQSFNNYLCATVHVAHAHKGRGYRWATQESSFADMKGMVPKSMGACLDLIEKGMLKGP